MFSTSLLLVASMVVGQAEAEQANVPGEFARQCEYYQGDWATEWEADGKVYRGTWTVDWSPEKACIVTHWKGVGPTGPSEGTRIHGWDASTNKVLIVDFGKDGGSSIERYKILSDQVDEGEISRVDADGTKHKLTARTDRMEKDRFTWTVTEDEKSTVYTFRRVKK